ncbi:MAG TPA: 4-(cytidine 5'-diphospho)-2-C-methyl-D-erythritol kinase [Savagea sp.]
MLYEKAPAKINLTLDVLGKREDGYHEVDMVMTTIDLADRLTFEQLDEDTIQIQTYDRFIPNDQRNLAYQAAQLLKETYEIKQGVRITIQKKIPVAAGLAGGSTDAAAALRGLNRLWNLHLTLDELAQYGAKIGSDVPFCVYGGTARATGRGEQIEHIAAMPHSWVVLVKPAISVSTASIYSKVDSTILGRNATQQMVDALTEGQYNKICRTMHNALESITMHQYPEVARLKEKMQKIGADAVLMSGSGPTVFAIVKNEERAKRMYNGLRGFCSEVYCVRMGSER